jgi:hypothetical protein
MISPYTDKTLYGWLVWAEEQTSFLQAIATAVFLSDVKHYSLLRPVLLKLREMYSEAS